MSEAQGREQRRGRRWAMKALFMWDAQGGGEAAALVAEAVRMEAVPKERQVTASDDAFMPLTDEAETTAQASGVALAFAQTLTAGAIEHVPVIDALLDSLAPAWGPGRMAAVDRAVLRLAAYELRYVGTPPAVAVSEAVDLARAYSTAESPAFVNGVLGAVAPRPRARGPAGGAPSRPLPRARGDVGAPGPVRRNGGPT